MTVPVSPPPLPPALLSPVIVPAGVVKLPACVGVLGGCVAPGVAVSACDGDAVLAAGDDGRPDADEATLEGVGVPVAVEVGLDVGVGVSVGVGVGVACGKWGL
jgi:hypothetical protein